MVSIKEGHSLTGVFEEWRTIRPKNFFRGQVVRFFGNDNPDRKGKFGYGFLQPESGGKLFFCMPDLVGVEISNGLLVPKLLFVRHHCLVQPLEEPSVGDYVMYGLYDMPSGKKRARPWVYERDYEAAQQELDRQLRTNECA